MKKSLLTFGISISLILSLGATNLSAEEGKPLDEVPEVVEHTPYTTTRVSEDTTLRELAKRYYGDENDYTIIKKANKGIGMSVPRNAEVRIPITEKFQDQPEQLSWR